MKRSRILGALGTVLVLGGTVLAPPGSADAPVYGRLSVKGPGAYATTSGGSYQIESDGTPGIVVVSTAPGGTATYAVEVHNPGSTQQTYQLRVDPASMPGDGVHALPGAATVAAAGGLLGPKKLVAGTNGYALTIAPGKITKLTLQLKPAVKAVGHTVVDLRLSGADASLLDTMRLVAEQRPAAFGATPTTLDVKQGNQPFVGDARYTAWIEAPVVHGGYVPEYTPDFTVRVRNTDKKTARAVVVRLTLGAQACGAIVLTDAKVDVTASAFGAGYATPVLKPGATRTLNAELIEGARPPGGHCAGAAYWTVTGTAVGAPAATTAVTMAIGFRRVYQPALPPF